MTIKLLLAGDGGQGIQTIANLLSVAVFDNGLFVTDIPNFGLEQRGGVSLSFLQFSNSPITYPKFTKPDIMLILSEQGKDRTTQYHNKTKTKINIDNYSEYFAKNNILKISQNIFFLGLLGKKLSDQSLLKIDKLSSLLEAKLSSKPGWEQNQKAFQSGLKTEK